jgi:SOS-response transcriptional repressor LexA
VVDQGLASGERLVVDGAQKATPGALVIAIPTEPSSRPAQDRVAQTSADRAPIAALQAD